MHLLGSSQTFGSAMNGNRNENRSKAGIRFIISRIISGETNLRKIKTEVAKKFSMEKLPKNSEIRKFFPKSKLTNAIQLLLKRKPVRTISGVTPIAVMVRPKGSCRYGCIYCPFTGKAAKSYTGEEPAALRARENLFDPNAQVKSRLTQFLLGGHPSEKCEIIIMGGTFLEMPTDYKYGFVKGIYDALNSRKNKGKTLAEAKKYNETARHRVTGLTIETRPDVCGRKEIDEMLEFGATRVELGVQNPNNLIYKKINRGHTVADVVRSTQLLKDSSFKIAYHIMPGLPGSNMENDIQMIKKLFKDGRFKPDMLKIYPTLVMPGTELHKMLLNNKYEPYTSEEAADVISEFYRYIPKYVRVMRIQRDIPSNFIAHGVKKSNLREMVEAKIREKGIKTEEIRLREAGFLKTEGIGRTETTRMSYDAGKGKEIFIASENYAALAGFIRLRIPFSPYRKELTGSALIRELHVYGEEAVLGKTGKTQHRGIGATLLAEAEKIAREEFGFKKITAISGVGAREYFYKKGYVPNGPYVTKKLL